MLEFTYRATDDFLQRMIARSLPWEKERKADKKRDKDV